MRGTKKKVQISGKNGIVPPTLNEVMVSLQFPGDITNHSLSRMDI